MGVFGQAIIATPPKIGGVQLRAFSAFHALALQELDSPYFTAEREPTIGETTAALLVCSSRRADGLRKVASYSRARWWLCWLFHSHERLGQELAEHISESVRTPQTWKKEGEIAGKTTGAAWPYYVVSVIAQNFNGIPYSDLWDMPLAELVCHKVILAECNNDVEIAENELANIERRRKMRVA